MRDTINVKFDTFDRGVDPFEKTITAASFCNRVYTRNYMPENSIGIIPDNGYDPKHKTSLKCQQWLNYISDTQEVNINHAKNGGEEHCGQYLLDGVDKINKKIYEFHGCYFHGCQLCYTNSSFNTVLQLNQHSVYMRHYNRMQFIRQHMRDYEIIEIWEHTWDKICKESPLREYLEKNTLSETFNPRDSLYGGRTNAFCLYYDCDRKKNEEIRYIDFTSLYPYVQKYGIFPIGHPRKITSNFDQNKEQVGGRFFGLIKCIILPPRNLLFPVLPTRIKKRGFYTLCNQCAID